MYCISHQYFRLETGHFSPWQQAVICNFVGLRGTTAFIAAVLLRGNARLAWKCELRVCLRTAARVRGTRVGSAREVQLKRGSSAWNCSSRHCWVPYLYGTGTLRVKAYHCRLTIKKPHFYITGPLWWESTGNRCITLIICHCISTSFHHIKDITQLNWYMFNLLLEMNHYKWILPVWQSLHAVWFSTFTRADFKGFPITTVR